MSQGTGTTPRMVPRVLDGVTYDAEAVREMREAVIEMRDASLKDDAFDWAVSLSHVVAVLAFYAEELEKPE